MNTVATHISRDLRRGPRAAEILSASRPLFGEKGYAGTTIRAIAADADVNPTLVHHFFGAKQQVFIPKERLTAAMAQMVGVSLLRYVIRIEPLASADDGEIVRLVAAVIQRYIDGR